MRPLIQRLHLFRLIAPRVVSPVLPVANIRLQPRISRSFSQSSPRLLTGPQPPPSPRPVLPPNPSLSQRLKFLIKSYGWYALGVYIVLSALDFGVAFIGINLLGAEYVSQAATTIKSMVPNIFHTRPPEPGREEMDPIRSSQAQGGSEGLYAMIVLAYTIHKTLFFPVRVGLTAAFTPRFVGWLGQRGWAGAAGTRKAAHDMREKIRERGRRNSND